MHPFFPKILKISAYFFLIIGVLVLIIIYALKISDPNSTLMPILVVIDGALLVIGVIFAIWSYIWIKILK